MGVGRQQVMRWVSQVLDISPDPESRGDALRAFLMALILLNVLAVALETVEGLHARYGGLFDAFELFSVIVFTVEYLLRLWVCVCEPRFRHPLWGRLRFALTPMALVDLAAILPFYLPMVVSDLRFLRVARLFRLARLLKMGRYSEAMQTLAVVINSRREGLLVTGFTLAILCVLASGLIYFAEHDAQPAAFSSIPQSMWWTVVTLTTVGYGDVYPITPLGRLLAAVIAILGIGMFALPAGLLASGFIEEVQRQRRDEAQKAPPAVCPHCGKPLDAPPEE
ncbi:MAG: ion transporter [Armatimonadota bacterium]|nr:ion transporter [Armatimonadota bacterium]